MKFQITFNHNCAASESAFQQAPNWLQSSSTQIEHRVVFLFSKGDYMGTFTASITSMHSALTEHLPCAKYCSCEA